MVANSRMREVRGREIGKTEGLEEFGWRTRKTGEVVEGKRVGEREIDCQNSAEGQRELWQGGGAKDERNSAGDRDSAGVESPQNSPSRAPR